MEDRDWQSMENDALTSFSSHDNITRELFMADASAGIALPLRSLFLLKIHTGFSYMHFHFSGMDGYGVYAQPLGGNKYALIEDNPYLWDYGGKRVIHYTQKWMLIAFGFSFDYYPIRYFSAGLSFQISPLILCNGMDEHFYHSLYQPDKQFNDYVLGGLLLEPGAVLSFSPTQWFSIALDCSWRSINRTSGASYNRTYGTTFYVQEGKAGAGLSILNTGLRFKVRL
jgi:hypothetical protein